MSHKIFFKAYTRQTGKAFRLRISPMWFVCVASSDWDEKGVCKENPLGFLRIREVGSDKVITLPDPTTGKWF